MADRSKTRECGQCSVCCRICAVPELAKPPHVDCPFIEDGCTIYGAPSRPDLCSSFTCLWLRGCGLPEDRPDLSGVLCTHNTIDDGSGRFVFVQELRDGAVLSTGRRLVERLARIADVPIVVVNYGSVPPDDRGDRTIVRSELKYRARAMLGRFLEHLDVEEGIGVYELRMGDGGRV